MKTANLMIVCATVLAGCMSNQQESTIIVPVEIDSAKFDDVYDPCLLRNKCLTDGYIDSEDILHLYDARISYIGDIKYLCAKTSKATETCKTSDEWRPIIIKQESECKKIEAKLEAECESFMQTDTYKEMQQLAEQRYTLATTKIDMPEDPWYKQILRLIGFNY